MFLVDASWQPAPGALPMLAALTGHPYTTEVGAFNLELNLDPQEFTGDCFTRMHAQLDELLAFGRTAAETAGLHVVLAGTLPTIRKRDLTMANMVQNPRYLALNNALMGLRGEDYELHIKGTDELRVRQDSVMAEACNASFQVHLQVTPAEFANAYNVAQALSGPTLASATNSPLLFGKRLWAETRIALFEQSVDTRRPGHHVRERAGQGELRRRLGDVVGRRAVQGGHHPLPPAARPGRLRRSAPGSSPTVGSPSLPPCACTPARCGGGTGRATAISHTPTATCRTCASRIASCRPGRARSTRSPTPRCGSG